MKRAHKLLVLVALVLALTTMLPGALAYFTTNTEAAGTGPALQLGNHTTITEEYEKWVKTLTISNESDSAPVWVRARAYATDPSVVKLTYDGGANWSKPNDDGWCYYSKPVNAGTDAEPLKVNIGTDKAPSGAPEAPKEDSLPFDVTVIYEATPVQYDDEGNAQAPDWSLKLQPAQ